MHAILTGVTGPLGMALSERILSMGGRVTALVRPASPRRKRLPARERFCVIPCDLAALADFSASEPASADFFFHLGWSGTDDRQVRSDPLVQAGNIRYALDAAALAARLHCGVFVGIGSQAEYGPVDGVVGPTTPVRPVESYGVAKYAAGRLTRAFCADAGMRHAWCRVLSLYGPYDRETTVLMYAIRSLLKGERPSFTPAEQRWDFLYAADCADALLRVAERGRDGAVYVLGSGRAHPLREYLTCIRDQIDPALPLGIGERDYPPGQAMDLCADISALTRDTGFRPRYSFEEGIRNTIAWTRNNE